MKTDRDGDEQPMFASLDEFCLVCGIDEATKEQMRLDMLSTHPPDADEQEQPRDVDKQEQSSPWRLLVSRLKGNGTSH